MPTSCPSAFALAARVRSSPALRDAIARAVADEDAGLLERHLRRLGFDASAAAVQRLLDAPGPFLPLQDGWT